MGQPPAGNSATGRYCPATVTGAGITYEVYAKYWNCPKFRIGDQINGKFTTTAISIMVQANSIEFAYEDAKNKLHHYTFIIDSQRQ